MIDEIKNPLPTIFQYLSKKAAVKRIKKQLNTNRSEYDVAFETDDFVIKMLSERCNIDEDLSNKLFVALFEEIKKSMLNGDTVYIKRLGEFYIAGKNQIAPRFKSSVILKKAMNKDNKYTAANKNTSKS